MGQASRRHRDRHRRQRREGETREGHGCAHTIVYTREDFVKRVDEITGGKKVPVVYDSVGKDTFLKSLDCLAPLGFVALFGQSSGSVEPLNLGLLAAEGLALRHPPDAEHLRRQAREPGRDGEGAVRGRAIRRGEDRGHQTYPLKDAAKAHADLAARKTTGSTVEMYRDGIEPMLLAPAWQHVADPIERIFALLASYRRALEQTDCTYGCPIGSLALELHEPDPPVRELLAVNFLGWVNHVRLCLEAGRQRLPRDVDTDALATFILTTMEGGVMQARTHRSLSAFDISVAVLRDYFKRLESDAKGEHR
jgi:TetR/AcrR family transcriptional regulator, transcriptional repressor for nem operon